MLPGKLFSILTVALMLLVPTMAFTSPAGDPPSINFEQLREQHYSKAAAYYSKVMRKEQRRSMGQISDTENDQKFARLANQHYFALQKIKEGKNDHAEIIYRRIIREIMNGQECDHARLAVTTLLLALHCQRMGRTREARSVFLNFFRVVIVEHGDEISECACSAKVLGAYALFEMKVRYFSRCNFRLSLPFSLFWVSFSSPPSKETG